jgi:hypothetical protein
VSPGGGLLAYIQRGTDDYDRRVAIANVDATCPRQLKADTPMDPSGWYSAPRLATRIGGRRAADLVRLRSD